MVWLVLNNSQQDDLLDLTPKITLKDLSLMTVLVVNEEKLLGNSPFVSLF